MCGVIGVVGVENAARYAYIGLKNYLQHRGQESAGIRVYDGRGYGSKIGLGLVHAVMREDEAQHLRGNCSVGHVRYSTSGGLENAQPVINGHLAVAHNGNHVNYHKALRVLRKDRGINWIGKEKSDTQVLTELIATSSKDSIEDAIIESLSIAGPTYSLVIQYKDNLYVARDPRENRPLYIGNFKEGYAVASEERCLRMMGASEIEGVAGGKLIVLGSDSRKEIDFAQASPKRCAFEELYFAHPGERGEPDPQLFGKYIREMRVNAGMRLAREHPSKADLIIPILNSGYYAGIGYSIGSGVPLSVAALERVPGYIKRTFIEPTTTQRIIGVYMKFKGNKEAVVGQRVGLVEDTIVRLTTSSGLVQILRRAGAQAIDFRVAAPPIRWPCFYGVDFPERKELMAARLTVKEIEQYLRLRHFGLFDDRSHLIQLVRGKVLTLEDYQKIVHKSIKKNMNYLVQAGYEVNVDNLDLDSFTLGYLSFEGMLESMGMDPSEYCLACFSHGENDNKIPLQDRYWDIDIKQKWFRQALKV